MVIDRKTGTVEHKHFYDVIDYLNEGDVLVINDSKVIPARLYGHVEGREEALIELLLLRQHELDNWECLVKPGKRAKIGSRSIFGGGALIGEVVDIVEEGNRIIRFDYDREKYSSIYEVLQEVGMMPLPPYITERLADRSRYQTVYAREEGSAAAPTAGLHFTPELIESMRGEGFSFEEVTLHVGAGTFLPVKEDDATQHAMHTEHFSVTREAVENLLRNAGNIVAVGTTSVRTLESLSALAWRIKESGNPDTERTVGQWELYDIPAEFSGKEALQTLLSYMQREGIERMKAATQIMITPLGYRFRVVNYIITNFHQPKSTLLLLVSAYVGGDWTKIYDYALANNFRFLSYGDSSLLKVKTER
jgi:S-adenosylmethionine:tRNA ribosyltransferase-isomerase